MHLLLKTPVPSSPFAHGPCSVRHTQLSEKWFCLSSFLACVSHAPQWGQRNPDKNRHHDVRPPPVGAVASPQHWASPLCHLRHRDTSLEGYGETPSPQGACELRSAELT